MTFAVNASAQSLGARVAAAKGSVGFEYETRPNVCGDGNGITMSDDASPGWNYRSHRSGIHVGTHNGGLGDRCEVGPAHAVIRRDGSEVVGVRVTVGGPDNRADTELGDVSPADAANYLLDVAPKLSGQSADHAIMGAEIALDVVVWPRMLKIARDNSASDGARKSAVFWVSQEASAAATAGLDSVAGDDTASLAVRSDAVFFLAQRPHGEGIPALVRVAESSKSMKLRKDAIFFLAQSRDDRALALFEKLLTGR